MEDAIERQSTARPSPGTQTIRIRRALPLDLGGTLPELELNYAEWGTRGAPVVFICPSMSHSALVTTDGLLTHSRHRDTERSEPGEPGVNRSDPQSSSSAGDQTGSKFHPFSPGASPPRGWWQGVVGQGASFGIDLHRFHVIAASPLGGPYGSTSPVTLDPRTGHRYRADFPQLTPADQARAHAYLLDHLGVGSALHPLHAVVGGSMGGMQALCFAALFPERWRRCVALCCTGKTSPTTQAFRAVQRALVESDPCWRAGHYPLGTGPALGLGLARALGTILYRSRQEFDARFTGPPRLPTLNSQPTSPDPSANPLASLPRCGVETSSHSHSHPHPHCHFHQLHLPASAPPLSPASIASPVLFEVEGYLAHAARSFPARYDANCWLLLSRCLDLMDLGRGLGGSVESALSRLSAERHQLMLLPIEQDALIPADEMQQLADVLARLGLADQTHFERLSSIYGHDAFLKEDAAINARLAAFLDPDASSGVTNVRQRLTETKQLL